MPVDAVTPAGPADRAGIRTGDVLTAINGERALSAGQLTVAELAARSGGIVEVTHLSGGTTRTAGLSAVPQA